jgi:hypothetical protein
MPELTEKVDQLSEPIVARGNPSGTFRRLLRFVGPMARGARPFRESAMREALQSTLILVLWIVLWLVGTLVGAVLQAWLVDIGVVSGIDPPWIITIGSSFIGFFVGAYAAVKLGDLTPRKK